MKFRTEIIIPSSIFQISHRNKIMMIGSCFTENISAKLNDSGFRVCVNPFGIMYNPVSIQITLEEIIKKKQYRKEDLFYYQGIYHSFSHHSRFSEVDFQLMLDNLNTNIEKSYQFLKETDYLIITYGTSNVYYLSENNNPVANCHKLPSYHFFNARLNPEEIVKQWNRLLCEVKEINPSIKTIFTISPIRHWKDGAHENQVSKSVLFVAVDELIKQNENVHYFPSYEFLMDDLRDYRFYAEDMIHPGNQAINYIWNKFMETYFSDDTRSIIKEWEKIRKALNHRPLNPESGEYKLFLDKVKKHRSEFLKKNPDLKR